MPSITITEKDLTTGGGSSNSLDVVFVPGFTTLETSEDAWEKQDRDNFPGKGVPTLCKTLAEFKQHFGKIPAKVKDLDGKTDIIDKSYVYATKLISAGIPVLYESVNDVKESILSVGGLYQALTNIYNETPQGFETLYDKGEYSFKYLTSGGYPSFQVSIPSGTKSYKLDSTWSNTPTNVTANLPRFAEHIYEDYEDHLDYVYVLTYNGSKWEISEKNGNEVDFEETEFDSNTTPGNGGVTYITGISVGQNTVLQFDKNLENVTQGSYIEIIVSATIDEDNIAQANIYYTFYTAEEVGSTTTSNTIAGKMRDLASKRGDCVALLDHPDDDDKALTGAGSFYDEFVKFGKGSVGADYCAAFTPWVNIDYLTYSGTGNNKKIASKYLSMPPSFGYLMALANSIKTNASWLAVAGASRGQIPGLYTDKPFNLTKKITNAIAETSYQNRDGVSINAITDIKPFGYRIWGNRTLKYNSATGEANLTATSFLNIRNMISDVKKVVYAACMKYTFEQNTDVLWVNFKAAIEPTLNQMKTGAGLSGYKIIKGTTTEKAKLVATIKLYPLYAVEDFDITVEMLDDEVSVS